jgi:hypothetical protein
MSDIDSPLAVFGAPHDSGDKVETGVDDGCTESGTVPSACS